MRFADGAEESLQRDQLMQLARYKEAESGDTGITVIRCNWYERVIYPCVIGSQCSRKRSGDCSRKKNRHTSRPCGTFTVYC